MKTNKELELEAAFEEFYQKLANGANCKYKGDIYQIGLNGFVQKFHMINEKIRFYDIEGPIGPTLHEMFLDGAKIDLTLDNEQSIADFLNGDD